MMGGSGGLKDNLVVVGQRQESSPKPKLSKLEGETRRVQGLEGSHSRREPKSQQNGGADVKPHNLTLPSPHHHYTVVARARV